MFPKKDYTILLAENLFGSFEIDPMEILELNKKVYNYINYSEAQVLTSEEKIILNDYYKFLRSTYFTYENLGTNEKANDIIFNYEQWTIFNRHLSNYQSFMKDYFISIYNDFIRDQFNTVFSDEMKTYNNYIDRLNNIYMHNKFENGKLIFDLIDENKLSASLKNIYKNYINDKDKKIANVKIVSELEDYDKFRTTHLIIKRG